MRVALLAKNDTYAPAIQGYLINRGHEVYRTDKLLPIETLQTCDIVISWMYRHILKQAELDSVKHGCYNLHPGHLPAGRGAMPNVWAIIQKTKAGATLHKMSAGLDMGEIVAQVEVPVDAIDTGETLYKKLLLAQYNLFLGYWPMLEVMAPQGLVHSHQQDGYGFKTNKVRDVDVVDDLESRYPDIHKIVDDVRARTFAPYKGCYIRDKDGKKVYLRLELYYED